LKVEEARQMTKLQLANELPTLQAGVSPLLYKLPGVTNTDGLFSVPILATYEVDLFLKNHDKTKSSKKVYEAAKYKEKAAYISIISAVGTCYYNIVKLDRLIAIQEQLIKDRNQIYDLMNQCNEEGIVSTSDLVKADKARVLADCEMIELKKSREVMLNLLAVLIGDSPNNTNDYKRISYKDLNNQKTIPQEIPSEIISSRPDYLTAEKMVEKAGIDVRVAKKEFLPSINIIGLLGFSSGSTFGSMSWENAIAGLVGSAMLPLFTGGKRRANLRIQKNKYEQALQTYYKTNLTAIQEVNDALSNLKLDNEKFQKSTKTLNIEKKDFVFTQERYNHGIISYLDLLQKKENLLDIEKLVTNNKMDCYVNQIGLYKAVAGADL
ncbi:MAG: TolC family protein, partial [bacterium]|nr:TolC family protein [bacterium]